MLSAVRSKSITMLAGVIAAVVLASVAIGLSSPDGKVRRRQGDTFVEAERDSDREPDTVPDPNPDADTGQHAQR